MRLINVIIICVAYYGYFSPCYAQFDDNKTFYERKDGGVTVVDPDRNIYGDTDYNVRTYDSRQSAYQNEYVTENISLQLGASVAVGAINIISDAGHALSKWYNSRMPNYGYVYKAPTNSEPRKPMTDEEVRKFLNTRY